MAYGKEKAKSLGKDIKFTLTTNGVLLNDDAIKYLNEEMDNVVISIDGRREIHDKLRVTPNGKGSYDIALKNAKNSARSGATSVTISAAPLHKITSTFRATSLC